jgi:glycine hydroxymethyltransferase
LTGQAFIDLKNAVEGEPLFIYQGAPKKADKAPADLTVGDRTTVPTPAVILTRFPK